MKRLSPREETVMRILWDLGEAFVKDIIVQMPDPKPPYNTVSSIVRILEEKEYVDHRAYGRTHQYFPVITRAEYKSNTLGRLVRDFFDGSVENVVSHMVEGEGLDPAEIERIKAIIAEAEQRKGGKDA